MIYTGGFFTKMVEAEDGSLIANGCYHNLFETFTNTDASVGLVLGSFAALICTIIFYVCRKVLSFKASMLCVPDGFKAMVPAILILTLAWTLKAMTDSLGAANYVAGLVEHIADNHALMSLLPAIVF